jgi:DNA-binding phage protein
MLRASATTTNTDIDLQGINGDADSAAKGIEFGAELMRFAEAIARRDQAAITVARQALLENAGPAVLIDAAGVAANFQRMVRIADAIGIPVDNMDTDIGKEVRSTLGIERFASAQNTLNAGKP